MTELELLRQEIATLKAERNDYLESNERFSTIFEHSRLGKKIIDDNLNILNLRNYFTQSRVNQLFKPWQILVLSVLALNYGRTTKFGILN
jgi:hypothetical protein